MTIVNRTFLTFVASLALVACSGTPIASSSSTLVQIEDVATGAYQTRPVVLEVNGEPALMYSTKSDRVAFQIGGRRQLLDDTARVKKGGSFFQLQKNANTLMALWWSHEDGKNVYFTSSVDAGNSFLPVSIVNDDHGILPPFSLVQAQQPGVLGVSYHDERVPGHEMFFNRSDDGGRTWGQPDQRLDLAPTDGRSSVVQEPQTVMTNTAWTSVWTDHVYIDGKPLYRIVARRSLDAGRTWSPQEVLHSSDHHMSALATHARGASIVVVADELQRGIFALVSGDHGATWKNSGTLGETSNGTNSGIGLVMVDGRAHLVWIRESEGVKPRILRANLDVANTRWIGAAQRLDTKESDQTKSISAVILATKQNTLVAAWVDYRDIRPNIYLSASNSSGESWSAPQPLLPPGEISAGWPQLLAWGDGAAIAYETYPTEVLAQGKLSVTKLSLNAAEGFVGLSKRGSMTDTEKKERLQMRVAKLWDARVSGDYAQAYEMFDFAYKSITPKKGYLDNVGVISYLAYKTQDMSVDGNEATVNMKTTYEVKPVMLPTTGKPISVAPIEVDLPTKWVWIGSDWFLVYTPSFDVQPLKY